MTTEEKKDSFIKYWEQKRENRIKYSIIQSLYFAIPFSIIFQAIEDLKGFITLQFGFKLLTIFSIYFLLTYYVSFKIHEKKYLKYKNKA
jgi:hypothetical protein